MEDLALIPRTRSAQLDYIGIVVLISGTFVPCVRYGFFCDPHLRNLYITLIYVAAACKPLFSFSPARIDITELTCSASARCTLTLQSPLLLSCHLTRARPSTGASEHGCSSPSAPVPSSPSPTGSFATECVQATPDSESSR